MFNQQGWGFFSCFFVVGFFLKPVIEHIQISLHIIDLYLVSNHQTKITTLQQLQRAKLSALHNLRLANNSQCANNPSASNWRKPTAVLQTMACHHQIKI